MISPSTSPGTKIVCIDVSNIPLDNTGAFSPPTGLTLGAEYTVDVIEPLDISFNGVPIMQGNFIVHLVELPDLVGFSGKKAGHLCQRFRRRDLPESLTRLTLRKPAPALG